MSAQSSMHFYLNWAKERIDEMDATLASLEAKASRVQADSKVKADQLGNAKQARGNHGLEPCPGKLEAARR